MNTPSDEFVIVGVTPGWTIRPEHETFESAQKAAAAAAEFFAADPGYAVYCESATISPEAWARLNQRKLANRSRYERRMARGNPEWDNGVWARGSHTAIKRNRKLDSILSVLS